MKWMIRVDMEGLTGVVSMNQVVPGASEYAFGQQMLKHDLESVIAGLLQQEEDEVVLYDIHFYGRNIDFAGLDPRVSIICGKPDYTPANMAFLNSGFDGMVLLGLHAKAETSEAVLAHNYEHDIRSIIVKGQGTEHAVGEIGLEALIAGEAGVPLVMVTGDSDGAKETGVLLPGTITVTVKESLGEFAAACYAPSVTGKRLRLAAQACAELAAKLPPFVLPGPIELHMRFKPGELLQKLQLRLQDHFVGPDSIILTGKTVVEAWHKYLIAKA